MSDPSLDQLTTPLTLDDVRTSIYAALTATGVTTTTWKPGAVVRTIILGVSLVIAALSQLVALLAQSRYVALATGTWLALGAKYDFGVTKLLATFASGTVKLDNTGGGVYGPIAAGSLVVASATTGKKYRNVSPVSIAALQTNISVAVAAVEAGSASSAAPADITTIVAPNLTGVVCTNLTALVGTDDEPDPDLRARCEAKLGALSPNGPSDAYRYVATSAGRDAAGNPVIITALTPGVSVGVNRVRAVKDGVGGLDVYLATASGGVAGTVDDLATDLGVVDDLLQQFATPLATTLRTHTATTHVVNVSYTIWIYTSALTDAQITAAISAALAAFLVTRPIGGDVVISTGAVWLSALEAVVGSAKVADAPIGAWRIDMGGSDTVLSAFEVPVLGTVTATAINRVSRAGT